MFKSNLSIYKIKIILFIYYKLILSKLINEIINVSFRTKYIHLDS